MQLTSISKSQARLTLYGKVFWSLLALTSSSSQSHKNESVKHQVSGVSAVVSDTNFVEVPDSKYFNTLTPVPKILLDSGHALDANLLVKLLT